MGRRKSSVCTLVRFLCDFGCPNQMCPSFNRHAPHAPDHKSLKKREGREGEEWEKKMPGKSKAAKGQRKRRQEEKDRPPANSSVTADTNATPLSSEQRNVENTEGKKRQKRSNGPGISLVPDSSEQPAPRLHGGHVGESPAGGDSSEQSEQDLHDKDEYHEYEDTYFGGSDHFAVTKSSSPAKTETPEHSDDEERGGVFTTATSQQQQHRRYVLSHLNRYAHY